MEATRFEQRAYIKIIVLRGRNAMECHSEFVESLGNIAQPYRTLAWWVGKFQQGRVSTSIEQRSRRKVSVRKNWSKYPPYSPDISPCDFDLIPKTKETIRGRRFATRENIANAVRQQVTRFTHDAANTEVDGIQCLPHRCQRVVTVVGPVCHVNVMCTVFSFFSTVKAILPCILP
ncbi:uncharacterized protein TNCV_2124441 [Trichonephila clavipes]|uniref:Mos1 transposase HTH domain-containing protein n=1 Tax=Trichonephila clavipes TaxID=2585209 RepID=A0A8X6UWP7_TRICX|nr:uncharacterized protein TNCV_2124441 [Trichonephila clavipes]